MYSSIIMLSLLGITLGRDWHYRRQYKWPGLCKNGERQSPVNILTSHVIKYAKQTIEYKGHDKASSFTMKNIGYTVQLVPKVEREISIRAKFLDVDYLLDQVNFHWSSEHLINNEKFILEAQFVHYNSSYKSLSEALKNKRAVAIISVLYKVSDDNKSFDKIIKGLFHVEKYPATHQIDDFKIAELGPTDHMDYYSYMGSLTIPDCTEEIIWIIIKNPSTISMQQVQQFANIRDEDGKIVRANYRKAQDLSGRLIYGPDNVS